MIRQIPDGQRWRAAELASHWGYPRLITPREVETGNWFEDGRAVCWFVPVEPPSDGTVLAVHAIGDPEQRRRGPIGDPRTMVAVEVIAELLGATKLYAFAVSKGTSGIKRYLRRCGWIEDRWGVYKTLGG